MPDAQGGPPPSDPITLEDLYRREVAGVYRYCLMRLRLPEDQLEDVLDTLTDREEEVLRLRFGLDDGKARTLEEVGRVFGVTRERIRQIEAKALRKVRQGEAGRKGGPRGGTA